jgi:hypothetical protein
LKVAGQRNEGAAAEFPARVTRVLSIASHSPLLAHQRHRAMVEGWQLSELKQTSAAALHWLGRRALLPQPLEPPAGRPRVTGSVPWVTVTEVILDHPKVGALVGQGEAAGMAQHVRPDAP